jgi:hypothetical protein
VRFVSSQTGHITRQLDELWHDYYGTTGTKPPSMRMPLDRARALLGAPEKYTKDDVISCFRRAAKKAHPDQGGTAEMFRTLVEARDRLLGAIGTKAAPPKPPEYKATGTYRYVSSGSSQRRLTGGQRRIGRTS